MEQGCRGRLRHPAVAAVLAMLLALVGAQAAGAIAYAPLDRPGPALSVPPDALAASVACTGDVKDSAEPVLLVPATTVDSAQNFSWNYEPFLSAHGIAYCTSDLPGNDASNMDDIQNRADYLVYAIRYMYGLSGKRIALVGSSQGGEAERWPLRFWPDTRAMVADVVALDSPNHGTLSADPLCLLPCAPAIWQQTYQSHFIRALNSGQETFAGIDYTDIYTYTDDIVEPDLPGNSTVALHGPGQITNLAIQNVCPVMIADHLLASTSNPVEAELTLDAVTHPGPADRARIGHAVCADLVTPGVSLATSTAGFTALALQVIHELLSYPKVTREPPLRCYVLAVCSGSDG